MKISVFLRILALMLMLVMVFSTAACSCFSEDLEEELSGSHDHFGSEDDPEDDKPSYNATVQDVMNIWSNLSAGEGDGISKDELYDAIPTFDELIDKLQPAEKKNEYISSVKSLLDGLKGEVGQIRYTVNDNGKHYDDDDVEIFYAGIKDGAFYMQSQDPDDATKSSAVYVCYDDRSVYCINYDKNGKLTETEAIQYPYNDMYDEFLAELPNIEKMYNSYIEEMTTVLDMLFEAMDDAGSSTKLELPELTVDSLVALERKANTWRLSDAYIDSVVDSVVASLKESADLEISDELIGDVMGAVSFYPYVTVASATEFGGAGICISLDAEKLLKAVGEDSVDLSGLFLRDSLTLTKGTYTIDTYLGVDGVFYNLDVDIPDVVTMKAAFAQKKKSSTVELTVKMGSALELTVTSNGRFAYDETTGNFIAYKQEAALQFRCTDSSVLGEDLQERLDLKDSVSSSNPFTADIRLNVLLDVSNALAENTDILTQDLTVKIVGGQTFNVDLTQSASIKSEETGAYRVSLAADAYMSDRGNVIEDADAKVSFRFAVNSATQFPSIPYEIQSVLSNIKSSPDLWAPCDWCSDSLNGTGGKQVTLFGEKLSLCDSCYGRYQGTLLNCEDCNGAMTDTYKVLTDEYGNRFAVCEDCYEEKYVCTLCRQEKLDCYTYTPANSYHRVSICGDCADEFYQDHCRICDGEMAYEDRKVVKNGLGAETVICVDCYESNYVCGECEQEVKGGCYDDIPNKYAGRINVCKACYDAYYENRCMRCEDELVADETHVLSNKLEICDDCYQDYYQCDHCAGEMADGYYDTMPGEEEGSTEYVCRACYKEYAETLCDECEEPHNGYTYTVGNVIVGKQKVCDECYHTYYVCGGCEEVMSARSERSISVSGERFYLCDDCYDDYAKRHCDGCSKELFGKKHTVTDASGNVDVLCDSCYLRSYECKNCYRHTETPCKNYIKNSEGNSILVCHDCWSSYKDSHCDECGEDVSYNKYTVTDRAGNKTVLCGACYREDYCCARCSAEMANGYYGTISTDDGGYVRVCRACYKNYEDTLCDNCDEEMSYDKFTMTDAFGRSITVCGSCYNAYHLCGSCGTRSVTKYHLSIVNDNGATLRVCKECYNDHKNTHCADCNVSFDGTQHVLTRKYLDPKLVCDTCYQTRYLCAHCGNENPYKNVDRVWDDEKQSQVYICEPCYVIYRDTHCAECDVELDDTKHVVEDNYGDPCNVCDSCYKEHYVCGWCSSAMTRNGYTSVWDEVLGRDINICENCDNSRCDNCDDYLGTHIVVNSDGYAGNYCNDCYTTYYVCYFCNKVMPDSYSHSTWREELDGYIYFCGDCYEKHHCDYCSNIVDTTNRYTDSYGDVYYYCDDCYYTYYVCALCEDVMYDGYHDYFYNELGEPEYVCQTCYNNRCEECGYDLIKHNVVDQYGQDKDLCEACYDLYCTCAWCEELMTYGGYTYIYDDELRKNVYVCQDCYNARCDQCSQDIGTILVNVSSGNPQEICADCYATYYLCNWCEAEMPNGAYTGVYDNDLEKYQYVCETCYNGRCTTCHQKPGTHTLTNADPYTFTVCDGCYLENYVCGWCEAEMPNGYASNLWNDELQIYVKICEECSNHHCDRCDADRATHSMINAAGATVEYCDTCYRAHYLCGECRQEMPDGAFGREMDAEGEWRYVCKSCYGN